jgi:hypothetical protein
MKQKPIHSLFIKIIFVVFTCHPLNTGLARHSSLGWYWPCRNPHLFELELATDILSPYYINDEINRNQNSDVPSFLKNTGVSNNKIWPHNLEMDLCETSKNYWMDCIETWHFSLLKKLHTRKTNFFAIGPVVFAPGTQTCVPELHVLE